MHARSRLSDRGWAQVPLEPSPGHVEVLSPPREIRFGVVRDGDLKLPTSWDAFATEEQRLSMLLTTAVGPDPIL